MPKAYKRNTKYWTEEQEKLKNWGFNKADELDKTTMKQYETINNKMKAEIDAFYKKFYKGGEFEGVTTKITASQLEALKREYSKLMEKYGITYTQAVGDLGLNKQLNQADSLLHKLNIDYMIPQSNINEDQLRQLLYDTYERNYYRSIYMIQEGTNIMGSFNRPSEKAILKIVNQEFLGETFSDRIWINKNDMMSKMKDELIELVTQNKNRDQAVKSLSRRLEVNYSDSKRLIYTEQARLMENVAEDSYNETGVDQFEYVATLDDRTSDVDKSIDGNVYDIKDYKVGVNAPPLHPYCRGTTIPYFDDISTTRMGRDLESGKSQYMPKEIQTYSDWSKYQGLDS